MQPAYDDHLADWDRAASDVVAILRSAAGRDPYDRAVLTPARPGAARIAIAPGDPLCGT